MSFTSRIEGYEASLAMKAPVRVATTANITLSGLQTIDGVAVLEGNRVLARNQAVGTQNGIYVASIGAWARAKDWNGARDATKGTRISVTDGFLNAGKKLYVSSENPINIGVTSVLFLEENGNGSGGVSLPIAISDVTGLQAQLDGKAVGGHSHPQSSITNLVSDLAAKAASASLGALAFLGVVATANIANGAVTYQKMQNGAVNSLLGYSAAGSPANITLGTGLVMNAGVLSATGGGGGGGATTLDGLSDVTLSTPAARQVLRHDGTDWKNARLSFGDLAEVNVINEAGGFQTFVYAIQDGGRIQFQETITKPSDFATLAIFRDNQSTGGTGVGSGLVIDTTAGANVNSNQWGLTSILRNYAPLGAGNGAGGENCAGYFQALHYNAGSSWGVAFEVQDLPDSNGNRGGILWGTENLVLTKRINNKANICVETLLTRNFGDGVAGRIYAYSMCDSGQINLAGPENTAQFGYLVGDKDNRIANGQAKPTVNNGFAVYANGITGFLDEGSKQVGLNLAGSYTSSAIRILANAAIAFEDTDVVRLGYNSGTDRLEATRGLRVSGALDNGNFAVEENGRNHIKNSANMQDSVQARHGSVGNVTGLFEYVTGSDGQTYARPLFRLGYN